MNSKATHRIGEVGFSVYSNTQMKIYDYNNCKDFEVIFPDGTVVHCKHYELFKKGHIKNPNNPYNTDGLYVGKEIYGFKITAKNMKYNENCSRRSTYYTLECLKCGEKRQDIAGNIKSNMKCMKCSNLGKYKEGQMFGYWRLDKFYNKSCVDVTCTKCNTSFKGKKGWGSIQTGESTQCQNCAAKQIATDKIIKHWGFDIRENLKGKTINNRYVIKDDGKNLELGCSKCNESEVKSRQSFLTASSRGKAGKYCRVCLLAESTGTDRRDLIDERFDGFEVVKLRNELQVTCRKCGVSYKIGFKTIRNMKGKHECLKCNILKFEVREPCGCDTYIVGRVVKVDSIVTNSMGCVVRFDDGVELHGTYHQFKEGRVRYPKLFMKIKKEMFGTMRAVDEGYYSSSKKVLYYICECEKCGLRKVMSIDEMKNHKC